MKQGRLEGGQLQTWKDDIEENGIILDSLWIMDEREKTGVHTNEYWGNFIPQIPHQAIVRFTKKNDWVLDTFVGSGTTLIKCKQLGRNGIGIELSEKIAKWSESIINKQENPHEVLTKIVNEDSSSESAKNDVLKILKENKKDKIQLMVMHPPYHNIIKFSDNKKDLSNANSVDEFLSMFKKVVENFSDLLETEKYLVLVIGDIYTKGEWIPLGFKTMQQILDTNKFILKSIVVKNMTGNRAKLNQEQLWRFRALKGGFYIFKHEYVMFFEKVNFNK